MAEKERYNPTQANLLAPGVYHLGVQDEKNSFANIPYLIIDGDEAVVIDPGSARPEFFNVVLNKIKGLIDPVKIKAMIVQHQDPDLCAALPLLEPLISPDYEILAPLEAQVLLQHYNTRKFVRPLNDGDTFTFGNNRTLVFAMTPYCHFVGSMVTYDVQTKVVFSSDAFGGFSADNELYAGENYPLQLSTFLGEYLGSKRALEYALKRLELLDRTHGINLICPQHGCVIPKNLIPAFIEAAHKLEVGGQVDGLAIKHGISLQARD